MIKKILLIITAMVLVIMSFGGCAITGGTTVPPSPTPEGERVSVIKDSKYKEGFNVLGQHSDAIAIPKVINYDNASNIPKWEIAQWWSKNKLQDGVETLTDNKYKLVDDSKFVEINRKNGFITLALDGSKEFDSFNPVPPPAWPHLLISQTFEDGMWLKDAEKVMASLDFTLEKNENLRGGTQGCQAQFAWFIYVVNKNPLSEGYGNFLWFGLNIFDSTKLYAAGSAMQDTAGGLGNYIYTVGASEFLSKQVKVGNNVKFDFDILPHISKALKKAQENGFMSGTSVEDCSLTGTNIGWEIFDRFDERITMYDIGIDIVKKAA